MVEACEHVRSPPLQFTREQEVGKLGLGVVVEQFVGSLTHDVVEVQLVHEAMQRRGQGHHSPATKATATVSSDRSSLVQRLSHLFFSRSGSSRLVSRKGPRWFAENTVS